MRLFCCNKSCHCEYCCCGFHFCSSSYWVYLWSIKVQLTPHETTVAFVVLDIVADVVVVVVVADVVVFVKVIVLALLVVTDHILFTFGQ